VLRLWQVSKATPQYGRWCPSRFGVGAPQPPPNRVASQPRERATALRRDSRFIPRALTAGGEC
jgi:hypothetical protein